MRSIPFGLGVLDLNRKTHNNGATKSHSSVNQFNSSELDITNTTGGRQNKSVDEALNIVTLTPWNA